MKHENCSDRSVTKQEALECFKQYVEAKVRYEIAQALGRDALNESVTLRDCEAALERVFVT